MSVGELALQLRQSRGCVGKGEMPSPYPFPLPPIAGRRAGSELCEQESHPCLFPTAVLRRAGTVPCLGSFVEITLDKGLWGELRKAGPPSGLLHGAVSE